MRSFISKIAPFAILSHVINGVPASLSIAQAILESGYGDSTLARENKNLFGIKGNKGGGGVFNTKEYLSGEWTTKNESFNKYRTYWGAFKDHARLLKSRYSDVTDEPPERGAMILQQEGYATDPGYARKLRNIIDSNDLKRFDFIGNMRVAIVLAAVATAGYLIYQIFLK